MTSRELVIRTLEFRNPTGRVPRDLWTLPWAEIHYPEELRALQRDFDWDIDNAPAYYAEEPCTQCSGGVHPAARGARQHCGGWTSAE